MLGPTGDGKIDRQAAPGMPPRFHGGEQFSEGLKVVRGEVREGHAVTDTAPRRACACGPDHPGFPLDASTIRLQVDEEELLGCEVLGHFDTSPRSAQIAGPARPGPSGRGILWPVQELECNCLAGEPPLGPPIWHRTSSHGPHYA